MRTVTYRARAYKLRAWRTYYAIEQSIYIRDLVRDKEWRLLQRSLERTWRGNYAANVAKLRAFMAGPGPVQGLPCPRRTRIVRNYIAATWIRLPVGRGVFTREKSPALIDLWDDIHALIEGEEAVIS